MSLSGGSSGGVALSWVICTVFLVVVLVSFCPLGKVPCWPVIRGREWSVSGSWLVCTCGPWVAGACSVEKWFIAWVTRHWENAPAAARKDMGTVKSFEKEGFEKTFSGESCYRHLHRNVLCWKKVRQGFKKVARISNNAAQCKYPVVVVLWFWRMVHNLSQECFIIWVTRH